MDDSLTRRTIAKLTAVLAVGGSAVLGWLLDAFDIGSGAGEFSDAERGMDGEEPLGLPRLRYVPMEAGHVGENIYLQAEALGLATVTIGAFRDDRLRDLLGVGENHRPLCIYPVGCRA